MSKRRHERKQHAADAGGMMALVDRIRPLLLPATVALLVAPHLIPSEAVAADGTHALPAMLWCLLLLVWGIVNAFSTAPRLVFTWSDAALLILVAIHTLSGVLPRDGVVTRGAWNVVWLWISYGVGYFLLRQLLLSSTQTRALIAVMIGLSICLAAHAYYQYFVTMPAVRKELAQNPTKVLKENEIPLDPDSPVRRHFEDRVRAVEPLATFALTNSLAGILAPWTIVACGLVFQVRRPSEPPVRFVVMLMVAIALVGCLLLTKSRTALLAVLAGGMLLGLFGTTRRWQLRWQWPVAIAGVLVILGLVAVAVGGLDAQVLSEAPKSVLYRLEYWRASAAMIAEYPLWGCGPGNFQDYYTHYKLPQASETVADPHNAFLEIWATAGTPALVFFLLWVTALVFDLARGRENSEQQTGEDASAGSVDIRRTLLGGAVGIVFGFALAFLTVYPLWTPASGGLVGIVLIGLPLTGIVLWMLQSWMVSVPLGKTLPVIALVTLLVNLSAAGAVSFPGVITSALILSACALAENHGQPPVWKLSRPWLAPLILAPLVLVAACLWTEYSPVLRRQAKMHDAQSAWELALTRRGNLSDAINALRDAAALDPASSEPWERLATIYLQQWMVSASDEHWQQFADAAEKCRRLRPARYQQHRQRGEWYLQAYGKSQKDEHLRLAVGAYQAAAERYPASALAHAQLAWVLHLAGDDKAAAGEANRALELDQLNPHDEFALRNQRLTDVRRDDGGWLTQRPETAEQTMQHLRKQEVPAAGDAD